MMTFSYVDKSDLNKETIEYFQSVNEFIDEDDNCMFFVVSDNDDIKCVFCASYLINFTRISLSFATKEKDRRKGYFEFGFYMFMEMVKNNSSIQAVYIDPIHEASSKLCKRYQLDKYLRNNYCFHNPNFDPRYEELYEMIKEKKSIEEIASFCEDDEIMTLTFNNWNSFRK